MSKEDLHAALDDFKDIFDSTVKQAAAKIDEASADANVRRNTLMWRVRMISACYTVCKQENDVKVFLDLWTLCIRMTQFFEEGDGRGLFGDQQPTAIAAAKQLETEIERIAKTLLSQEQFAKARKDAETFAHANPIHAEFTGAVVRSTAPEAGAPDAFTTIVNIPLAPFRAFEGVDRGAEAIHGFTLVADRFTDDFEAMPETLRWQLLLLLIELEDNKMIGSALTSFEQFSNSSARLSETAENLPGELRRQASGLIEEVDSKQGNIQSTLTQAEKTAAAIERTGQSVAEAGRAWEAMARAIGQTVEDIRTGGDASPAATASPPVVTVPAAAAPAAVAASQPGAEGAAAGYLDDYRRTAETLTATATELRLCVEETRKLLNSPQLTEHIRDVDGRVLGAVDQTARQARGVTDHMAWRAAELAVLVFILVFVYRAVARKAFKP